ncbi:hypothetical protein [Knoellia flava]|uniref:Uncharacterized protein n=1 Tax=Knoellia flava TaxID=913969 RepID=A0A8H9FU53_9MICO|nr:hypothetical protein [Knoellia flava]GGB86154.1 hypothetical protein GCM10011314_27410 [Knoellia flava]
MATPAAPVRPPVGLADLDAAQRDWQRSARQGLWVDHGWLVAMTFLFASQTWMGLWSPRSAGLIVLVVVAFRGAMTALGRLRDHRAGEPAAPGPSSLTTVRSMATGPELWSVVTHALTDSGFSSRWLVDRQTLNSTRSGGWGGQRLVTVRLIAAEGGGAWVTVWSRPAASWWQRTTPDFGRSRRDANAVLRAVCGATPVAERGQSGVV